MNVLPVLLKDGYKVGHRFQYPEDTELVYSNFTPRSSRREGVDHIIFYGLQYFIMEYLIRQFNENFFAQPREKVVAQYKRRIDNYLGPDAVAVDHIGALHDLGYLPLRIKALPEGTKVPIGVPVLTIRNTHPDFFWLTNMLETLMSNVVWKGCTSATTAFEFLQTFVDYAERTVGNQDFVPWQGHDFSFRGMSGVEDAMISGSAHLLSFTGTDTIPAIDFLEHFYGADSDTELIGGSVAATEHSVMCMGLVDGEQATFERLLTKVYPTGILSVVSDTWDFWKVITEYLPSLKETILARDGKLVIRPDSGDPTKIIVGDPEAVPGSPEFKGAIECMWEVFGGTLTDKGFKLLDSHIGLIYGDNITTERQKAILSGLENKGFCSYNVVLGIGSFHYQYVTRDTFGFAMKATFGKTTSGGEIEIWKDPATDDGGKRSARGLLAVESNGETLSLRQQSSWEEEAGGLLRTVFLDGEQDNVQTLSEIRELVRGNLT